MKIAFIMYPGVIISNRSNGIRSQAVSWCKGLVKAGHEVVCVSNWEDYDWNKFDIIHLFGFGSWLESVVPLLAKLNSNLVLSPIIDPNKDTNYKISHLKYYLSNLTKGKIQSYVFESHKWFDKIKIICTRSDFESSFINKLYGIDTNKLFKIPLSYDEALNEQELDFDKKETFCLHISSIYQSRKNVVRLIEAAKKFKFKLVLAGNKGSDKQFEPLKRSIGNANNIKVLGFISNSKKIELYKRAKVFALPSLQEGVGIVALDAAVMGCEIAITNIPGPKEYYNGMCTEIDPLNVDSIGVGICNFLNGSISYQPQLSSYIKMKYSYENVIKQLVNMYSYLL